MGGGDDFDQNIFIFILTPPVFSKNKDLFRSI